MGIEIVFQSWCKMLTFNTLGADSNIYVIRSNVPSAEWHIYICHSLWDLSIRKNDNMLSFFILVFLQWKFSQVFFMPRYIDPENFMQIDQKLFQLWSFTSNHLAGPRQQGINTDATSVRIHRT